MASKDDVDPILANEQRLKNQKQIVQNLHRQLKVYNEAFRHFISAEKIFYETLDSLFDPSWELKSDFSGSIQALGNIAENGARSLETMPVEETIVFRDQFGPFEKEIADYKEKQKISDTAERKHMAYSKKKSADVDELRKLELLAYEKKTSLAILRRKLSDELPAFYQSRMDYYSTFWRSVFQIRSDIARAECETLDQLNETVRRFDSIRSHEEKQTMNGSMRYTGAAATYQGSEIAASSNVRAGDESSISDQTDDPQQQQQQQQPQAIRRVPTFGGNDMSNENSGRSKPPVPRRSSLRSQSQGRD